MALPELQNFFAQNYGKAVRFSEGRGVTWGATLSLPCGVAGGEAGEVASLYLHGVNG